MGLDDGATYSSIDPVALGGAANALKRSVDGVQTSLETLRSRFGSHNVSTGNLDKLRGFAHSIDALLPEMRRRQSMAAQMVASANDGSKVAYFTGDVLGQFKTVEAAKAQAAVDARSINDSVKKGEIPDDVYAHLKQYGNDPDYTEALMKQLGIKGQAWLIETSQYHPALDDDKTKGEHQKIVGELFATASSRMTFDKNYLTQLNEQMKDFGLRSNEHSPISDFVPLMKYGTWDKTDLKAVADVVFKGDDSDLQGMSDARVIPDMYNALGNNPIAAGEYFAANRKSIYDSTKYNSNLYKDTPGGDAVARFLRVATVDSRGDFARWQLHGGPKPNAAEENAQWLVNQVSGDGEWSDRWGPKMDQTFAQIGKEYIDDYAYSMGSPVDVGSVANPTRDGIEVGKGGWQQFMKVAMHDNTATVVLGTSIQQKIDELRLAANGRAPFERNRGGNDADTVADANGWSWYTIGAMQSSFAHNYADIVKERGDDATKTGEALKGLLDKGIDYATDPKGIPKDLAKSFVSSLLGAAVDASVHPEAMPPSPVDSDVMTNYSTGAVQQWQSAGKDTFKPYNDGDVTWDGDPHFYETPPGAKFTQYFTPNGQVDDAIKKDPQAWAAYNDWLTDPAVAASLLPSTANAQLGQLQKVGQGD